MWLYYLCNRNKWYETQIFHGGSKFHSVQWSLNSWPFAGKSGTGQCTHCRGGAESVLTLSPTVIGVGLHRLGANLTRRKGKYTSASPRCTCLPSRQICIGVALGDPPQTPLQCWLVGRTSTPRLRLGVLASQLVNIALKLHSVDHRGPSMDLIGVCGGSPRATPLKFNFGQVELETKSVKFNTNYRWT